MKKKTIQEALAEVQKKLDEAPVVSLAQLNAFRNQVGNQNATLGQYMNAQQNKTAKVGGVNDPNVIARTQNLSATTGYSGGQAAKAPYVPPAAPTTTSTSPSQMGPGENRPGLAKPAAPIVPSTSDNVRTTPNLNKTYGGGGNENIKKGEDLELIQRTYGGGGGTPTPDQAAKGLSPTITGGGIGSDGIMPPAAKYGMPGAPALPVTTQNASGAKGSDTDRPPAPANQLRSVGGRPMKYMSGEPIVPMTLKQEPAPAPVEPPKANPAYDRSNSSQFNQPGLNQSGQLGYPENDTKTNPYTPPVKAKAADEETNTKGKAKVTESKLISAFFALQEKTNSNMFEAVKNLSPKQKEIASLAGDKNKIDASDLKKLRSKGLEEDSVEDSKEDKKADKAGEKKYGMTHKEWEKSKMDKEADDKFAKKMGKKIEETKDNWEQNSPAKRKADAKTLATKTATPFQKSVSEELFSEDELNRLNEIAEAIAKTSAGDNYITQRGGEGDRLGPTLGNQMSLTDEKKSKKVSK